VRKRTSAESGGQKAWNLHAHQKKRQKKEAMDPTRAQGAEAWKWAFGKIGKEGKGGSHIGERRK